MLKYHKETDTIEIPANMLPAFKIAASAAASAGERDYKLLSIFSFKQRRELRTFISHMRKFSETLDDLDKYCKEQKNA